MKGDEVHRLASPFDRRAAPGVEASRGESMKPGWKVGLSICTARFTETLTERSHREEFSFQNRNGRQRPLGVAALENKIVQQAVVSIINQIYEDRPGRSQHQALDALYVAIMRKKVNWILYCDIRGFFR